MELKDVPNEPGRFKDRDKLKKVVYATDKNGHYETAQSAGWEVENMATRQAWDDVAAELEILKNQVKAGTISPIPFYMKKCLMDIGILAKHMGKFRWQIKRHFKPSVFKKLEDETLQKYCSVFKISIIELKQPDF